MNNNDIIEIDLLRLAKAMWHRAWAIVLAMAICGGLALGYTALFVTPLYKASALMYVNSSDISVGGTKLSISQSELTAAQSLIDTYAVILKTRTTLNDVIERTGVPYSYEQIYNMITAESVNGTEVFRVEVTSANPEEAMVIANAIATILPEKISSIVEGTSVRIVDSAVIPTQKASPSISKNTMIGILLGAVLSCGIVVVMELMDDKIHDSDYLVQTYDIPMLSVIPDLTTRSSDTYSYYRSSGKKNFIA